MAVAAAGATWTALCLWLAADGHRPSVTLVPIPAEDYYRVQAAFVTPLLFAQWALCAAVAAAVARALGSAARASLLAGPLAVALAGPLVALHLTPDLIAYACCGFDALGAVVRVTAPLVLITSSAAGAAVVRAATGSGWGRAAVAAGAGVLAQALAGGVLLR